MADLSSSISIPLATVPAAYQINAQVNVANAALSDIILLRIVPQVRETSSGSDVTSHCEISIDISKNPRVLAGSSNNYLMKVIFHAPSLSGTYDLNCDVYGTNGELVSPSPVTVTVTRVGS